jgi:hypothetical protein
MHISVDIDTGWTTGVRFPAGTRDFSLHHSVKTGSGVTQLPIQWVPGALSPGVKRPGREADDSPPSSTEVKNDFQRTTRYYIPGDRTIHNHRCENLKSYNYSNCFHNFELVQFISKHSQWVVPLRCKVTCQNVVLACTQTWPRIPPGTEDLGTETLRLP